MAVLLEKMSLTITGNVDQNRLDINETVRMSSDLLNIIIVAGSGTFLFKIFREKKKKKKKFVIQGIFGDYFEDKLILSIFFDDEEKNCHLGIFFDSNDVPDAVLTKIDA